MLVGASVAVFARVALFTRAWIEIKIYDYGDNGDGSPSSRGRGLKSRCSSPRSRGSKVALFTRAWIEIDKKVNCAFSAFVALFTRAWIEITEIAFSYFNDRSPSSRGRGSKSARRYTPLKIKRVALFTRAWIEMFKAIPAQSTISSPSLHEGVD